MRAYERLLKYVVVRTPSDENSETVPSSQCQFDLANILVEELKALGIDNAYVDEKCFVYGKLAATPGYENAVKLGFIAHMDTVSDFCDHDITPVITENYNGEDLVLGASGRVLSVKDFPHLPSLKGRTLITTDGTTVLGADDKAGIAEIMTMLERIITENIPHGQICVAFTPDEEIGTGAQSFNVENFDADFGFTLDGDTEGEIQYENFNACKADFEITGFNVGTGAQSFNVENFDADFGFTLDGDTEGEIQYENFNACKADFEITGFNVHPGSSKNAMINASLVAMEINSLLPGTETPRDTEDYEGFYHLMSMTGEVASASLHYIVRDHDASLFEARKNTLRHIEKIMNEKWGEGTVRLTLTEQYRNMAEVVATCMHLIENAQLAAKAAGITPLVIPIRGGTDGCQLSFRGLPCPNLGTGGHGYHGPYEHITVEGMDLATDMVLELVKLYAK